MDSAGAFTYAIIHYNEINPIDEKGKANGLKPVQFQTVVQIRRYVCGHLTASGHDGRFLYTSISFSRWKTK